MEDKKLIESLIEEKKGLQAVVQEMDGELKAYKELATVDEMKQLIDKSSQLTAKVEGVDLDSIHADLEELAKYRAIGTPEKLEGAITSSLRLIQEYRQLGTPREIDTALEELKERGVAVKCEALAAKYNVKTSMVRKVFEKVNDFKTVEEVISEGLGRKPVDSKTGKMDESLGGKTEKTGEHNVSEGSALDKTMSTTLIRRVSMALGRG